MCQTRYLLYWRNNEWILVHFLSRALDGCQAYTQVSLESDGLYAQNLCTELVQTLYFVPLAHTLIEEYFNTLQQFLEAYCYSHILPLLVILDTRCTFMTICFDLFRPIRHTWPIQVHLVLLGLAPAPLSHLYGLHGLHGSRSLHEYVLHTYIYLSSYLFIY